MKTCFIVLLAILILCVLFSFLRLGGRVEYSASGFLAQVKIGPFFLTVFPRKTREKKRKEAKKKKPKKSAGEKERKGPKKNQQISRKLPGGSLQLLLDELPAMMDLMGEAARKLCVEELYLDYTIAGKGNPAGAAILYGNLCATGGIVAGLLGERLNIRKKSTRAWVDFTTDQMKVYVRLTLSYTVGQLTVLGIHVCKELLKIRKIMKTKNQEGNENGKQASNQ